MSAEKPVPASEQPSWTFFTNHTHVLVYLDTHPGRPLREAAIAIGITERAVQRIVAELEAGGVIERIREGRSNRYRIHREAPLRHPLERHRALGDLLDLVRAPAASRAGRKAG